MSSQDLREDLEFVRTLAEEGRAAPLLGGRFMTFWGALAGATLLAHWAIVTNLVVVEKSMLLWMWLAMSVGGGLVTIFLVASIKTAPGASAANNRASSAIWGALGLGIGAVFLGVFSAVQMFGAPLVLWNMLPGTVMVLYGMAYLATAFFQREGLHLFAGVTALIAGVGALAMLQSPNALLIAAGGVFLSTFLPGLVYLSREPKHLV